MNSKRMEEPHVSFSQINTYLGCPLKYRFNYVDQLKPEFVPAAIPFGGSFHEALAHYYRSLKDGQSTSLSDIQDVFATGWKIRSGNEPVRFDDGDSTSSLLDQGSRMLAVFHQNVRPGEVIAVEQEFTLRKMDNNGSRPLPLPIIGSIDLIERTVDGKIVAVDHKTASRKYSDSKVEDDLQLSVYTCAVARSTLANGDKEFHARFDVITKTKKPEMVSYPTIRTENDHRRLMRLIREVLVGIEAGVFYPIAGWMCGNCQFQTACRSW